MYLVYLAVRDRSQRCAPIEFGNRFVKPMVQPLQILCERGVECESQLEDTFGS